MPGFSIVSWGAFFGPANMPEEIVTTLNEEITAVLQDPEVIAAAAVQGVTLGASTPEELATYQKDQIDTWTKTVREAGIPLS